jgi:hypothetical protein
MQNHPIFTSFSAIFDPNIRIYARFSTPVFASSPPCMDD